MNQENLKLVGDFLRAKRESITPESVGLKKPSRTRTSGLRREDVAYFADISTVWYSKIERGQAAGISPQVLMALSKALHLTHAEYEYLCNLISPQSRAHKPPCQIISERTAQLMRQLNPLPSLLMNDYLDIVTCNRAFDLMVGFSVDLLPLTEKNYLHLTITNAAWGKFLHVDEGGHALHIIRMAGFLRDTLAKRPEDPLLTRRIDAFRTLSPVFDKAWTNNTVLQPSALVHTYHHALLGEISLDKQLWWGFSNKASSRLNIYYPKNEQDRQRLAAIMVQPLENGGEQDRPPTVR